MIYDFSIGQPHFPVDSRIIEEIHLAMQRSCRYSSEYGLDLLRDACVRRECEDKNVYANHISRDNCLIGNGVSGLFHIILGRYIKKGDSVAVVEPCYFSYIAMLLYYGVNIIKINENFTEIDMSIKIKMVIFANPSNPTGHCFDKKQIQLLAKWAKCHDALLISDEIYSYFDYDSMYTSVIGVCDNAIVLKGFSKAYNMTGLRLGYAISTPAIIRELAEFQLHANICVSEAIQYGGVKALNLFERDNFEYYKRNRDIIFSELSSDFDISRPSAGLYFFLQVKNEKTFLERANEFNMKFKEGSLFCDSEEYVRMSFAVEREKIYKCLDSIKRCML